MRDRPEELAPESAPKQETEAERSARHLAEAEKAGAKMDKKRERMRRPGRWRVKARMPLKGYMHGLYAATRASAALQKAGISLPAQVIDQVAEFQETRDNSFTLSLKTSVTVGEGNAQTQYAGRITGRLTDEGIADLTGISVQGQALVRLDNSAEGPTGVTAMGERLNLNDLQGFDP